MLDIRKIITAARDAVGETLYPTRCVGCDMPGYLVCPSCDFNLERIDLTRACRRCGAPNGALVCTECAAPGPLDASGTVVEPPFTFDAARCACNYEGAAKAAVRAYKDGDEQRMTPYLAAEMLRAARGKRDARVAAAAGEQSANAPAGNIELADSLTAASGTPKSFTTTPKFAVRAKNTLIVNDFQPEKSRPEVATAAPPPLEDWTRAAGGIVPVPPTSSHTRERGWEHLRPLAQLIARGAGLPLIDALQSAQAADQRQLGRQERAANRRSSISLTPGVGALPRTVILVDDVLTTGATCDACSAVLKNAGVERVLVLTFARVW